MLTGDTLFVNDVARPDLAIDRAEGARGIFRSLHERLFKLPPETEVWPGHLGGSLCGGPGMDLKVSSTIGYERRHNDLFAETEEDALRGAGDRELPPQPPNFQAIVDINRGPLLTAGVEVLPLASRQVEQKRAEGALLVDVRTDLQFDEAHIPGAVCMTMLHAGFGTRARLDRRPRPGGRADRARRRRCPPGGEARDRGRHPQPRRLPRRRHDELADEHRDVGTIERLRRAGPARRRGGDPSIQVLDVREQAEWDDGHIPGSVNAPYHDVRRAFPTGIDPRRARGGRSAPRGSAAPSRPAC